MVLAQNSITLAQVNDGIKGEGLEVVIGTQTASTNAWTGIANLDELKDGQQITYWLPYAGTSSNATLNLTLSDGTKTGAIPCYYGGTTRLTTHYAAGNAIRLLYRENVTIGSTTIAKGWWSDANYNTNNYDRLRLQNSITAKSAISASRLIVGDDSGFFHLAADTAFDVTKPILYAYSAISSGSTGTNNYLSFPSVSLRNNLSGVTLTNKKTCYLVGTLSGNTFTPNATLFTTTVPTTEDGLYYIALGLMVSTYQIYMYPEHPIYQYKDEAFKSTAQIAGETISKLVEDYWTKTETEAQLNVMSDSIKASVSSTYATKTALNSTDEKAASAANAAEAAQSTADNAAGAATTAQSTADEALTEIENTELRLNASIELTAGEIRQEVSETYTTNEETSEYLTQIRQLTDAISLLVVENSSTGELSSLLEQTSTGFSFNMTHIVSALGEAQTGLGNLGETIGSVDEGKTVSGILEDLDILINDVKARTAYIDMNTDEDGNPYIELGKRDAEANEKVFKVRITNQAMHFIYGTSTPLKLLVDDNGISYVFTEKIEVKELVQGNLSWVIHREGKNVGITLKGGA